MSKWVRTVVETSSNYPFEGIDSQSLPGWGEGTPVTIMPTADQEELVALLREAWDGVENRNWRERARRFLFHTEER